MTKVVVAAIGSEMRHDDGVGAAVVSALCRTGTDLGAGTEILPMFCPEPLGLLGCWDGADLAVVVDAVEAGGPPGGVSFNWLRGHDPLEGPSPARSSSHGLGITDVLEISRLIGTAPSRVVVVGIEGRDFSLGRGLSDEVAAALAEATHIVLETARGASSS